MSELGRLPDLIDGIEQLQDKQNGDLTAPKIVIDTGAAVGVLLLALAPVDTPERCVV